MPVSGFEFRSQSGCLLPMLIMLNLFFGRLIFNSNSWWLSVEGILVLLFIIKIYAFTQKISKQFRPQGRDNQSHKPLGKVIDVQGQEVEDENHGDGSIFLK
ncbi:MAG: hypothetical protein NTX01_04935 [Candidatus Omnitrophica bacterium]|nr:hypothetical protein [Candidatus Omnitrophota bacterium]